MAPPAGCSVRVAVRVRPLLSFERTERLGECVTCIPHSTQLCVGTPGGADGKNTFTFDFTFPKKSEQRALYEDCVASLLEAFFEGFNATILAYGQTGSGKTYTMGSGSSLRISEEEQGIIPRVITGMYDLLGEALHERPHVSYTVRCQFLEIYGEDIHDLLEPAGSTVTIREGRNGEVNVHGAKEMLVHGAEEMAMLLERGSLCRTTGSTLMNAHSSRSHAIFTVLLEQRIGSEGGAPADPESKTGSDDVEIRKSKFHFVDLAGSERAKRTGASGQRFKEGVDINKGLLTLGNVISALGDDTKRGKVHVPYRDSKLTRMLQDSLGGNSQTLMICCVSPAESNMHETLSALRYANRARNIQNKPVVNRDANSMVINELRERVQALAAELLRIKSGGTGEGGSGEGAGATAGEKTGKSGEGGGSISAATLRELAIAPTPPRSGQAGVLTRNLSTRTGSVDAPAPLQRELTMLRARAAEAESEVQRLTEEVKTSRRRESVKDDRLAEVKAELDLARTEVNSARRAGFVSGQSSSEGEGGPDVGADAVLEEIAKEGEGTAEGQGSGGEEAGVNRKRDDASPRTRALAVMKEFHVRIQALEERLQDSEQQRAALERRLVHQSGENGDEARRGTRGSGRVGAVNSTAVSGEGDDAVVTATKRLAEEKLRREKLLASLGIGEEREAGSGDAGSSSGREGEVDGGAGDEEEEEEEEEDAEEDEEDDEEEGADGRDKRSTRAGSRSNVVMAAEQEERALRKSETRINAELSDLDRSIVLKEALLARIKEGQTSFETMQQHYEHKLKEMDEEVRRHEQEHERLLADLEAYEKKTEVVVKEEREKLKKQLQEKMLALQKAKARQSELSELSRDRRIKGDTVKNLETEIVKMKKNKIELKKRLDSEQKRQRELLLQKSKEIESLKRSAVKDQAEVKRLERAKGKAEAISKRHLDELALIRRLQRQRLGVGRKQKLTAQERETKRLLDSKVKELTRREEAVERLAAEYEKKLLLLQQKENLELVKDSITSRRDQRQRRNRDAARRRLHPGTGPGFRDARQDSRGAPGASTSASTSTSPHNLRRTGRQNSPAQRQQGEDAAAPPPAESELTLRDALPAEVGLDDEELETLREVEERLESNKAQLEYKDRKIVSIEREVRAWSEDRRSRRRGQGAQGQGQGGNASTMAGSGGGSAAVAEVGEAQMIEELESDVNDLKGARGTIRVLFSSLVAARRAQKQKSGAIKSLQEQLKEANQAVEDTQERVRAGQRSYDRKLTSITAEYERKINGLINHTGMSVLLSAAIDRTSEANKADGDAGVGAGLEGGVAAEGNSGSPGKRNAPGSAGEEGRRQEKGEPGASGRRGSGIGAMGVSGNFFGTSGGDTTHDAMTKTLHERWLSEREKAKILEGRLKDAEFRICDLEEVRKDERKTLAEKKQDVEWLSYELRAFRSRCSQLRDEKEKLASMNQQLQSEAEDLRRKMGSCTPMSSPAVGRPPSPPPRPSSVRSMSPAANPASGGPSPSRRRLRSDSAYSSSEVTRERERDKEKEREKEKERNTSNGGRNTPVQLAKGSSALSPDHQSSDMGSEMDDVEYDEEPALEGGGVDFAGVTSDLEAIREGKMPESMQLVARINVEAGGKLSVFDRLASTTTESRRQKVNDRDQLQEHRRRKAEQEARRKKKEFKVLPTVERAPIPPPPPLMPVPSSASTSTSGHTAGSSSSASNADTVASLERTAAISADAGEPRASQRMQREGFPRSSGRPSLDDVNGAGGGAGLGAGAGAGPSNPRGATESTRDLRVFERSQVAGSTGKPATGKKYSRIAGGPGSSLAAKFVPTEAESSRTSNNDGSPVRTQTQTAEGRDRAGEESHTEDDAHVGRRDPRPRSKKEEVFHRLQSHLTESEWRRQAESKAATTGRLSVSRRVSHDVRDGVLPSAVSSASLAADAGAGGGATPVPALPSIASRRSADLDTSSGSSRADDHGIR